MTAQPLAFSIRGLDAWHGDTSDHITAQVTQLLCLGVLLQGQADNVSDIEEVVVAADAPRPRQIGKTAQALSIARLSALSLDTRRPGRRAPDSTLGTDSLTVSASAEEAPRRRAHQETIDEPGEAEYLADSDHVRQPDMDMSIVDQLWHNMAGWRSARSALAFLGHCMRSRSDLVRAMAAAVLSIVHDPRNEDVQAILQNCVANSIGYGYEFAAIALETTSAGEAAEDSAQLEECGPQPDHDADSDRLSIVVHGTFARLGRTAEKWYDPDAELPRRIRSECTPDLYHGRHYFRWSADYSPNARERAAQDLQRWCADRGVTELDTVFAHSHGGSVVLNAIERGLRVKLLVLLHTPVIPRKFHEWAAIESRTGRIMDLRTSLDWVVLLDGLKTHSRNELPSQLGNARRLVPSVAAHCQTSHTHYIKDTVWRSHGLANEVSFERSMV